MYSLMHFETSYQINAFHETSQTQGTYIILVLPLLKQ